METKGKRAARPVGPAATPSPDEIPNPLVAPGESAGDIKFEPAAGPLGPEPSAQPAAEPAGLLPGLPAPGPSPDPGAIDRDALAMLCEYRAAVTHGLDALSGEAAALARGGIEVSARTAIDMLAVRTLSDALAVAAGFARASFDNWIGGSARFSALGAKLAVDSWHPLLAQLSKSRSLGPG